MANAADDLAEQLTRDIEAITVDGEFDADLDKIMTDQIIKLWRENSPEDSGEYKDSIEVINPAEAGHAMVGATADHANLVEYGTEKTPEFAPMRRTIEQLNGQAS